MNYNNLQQYTDSLNIAFKSLNESFYEIGEMLYCINQDKLYKDGYKSFTAYCKQEFQISKTKAYAFIKIYKLIRDNPKFKDCNYSQLQEISTVKEDDLNNFSPDMTVSEIRDKKKELKGETPVKTNTKAEIEEENEKLVMENKLLRQKLQEIKAENSSLKNKLSSLNIPV